MMGSSHYFDYLGSVWSQMPEEDKARLGELWQGYEQIFAAVYQKFAENHLNIAMQDVEAFTTERWLPYVFNDDNFIEQPAVFTSSQDISLGINLTVRRKLNLKIDNRPPLEVDVVGEVPGSTKIAEIIAKLNTAHGFALSRSVFEGSVLQLVSPTTGINSKITILETANPAENAAEFILGVDIFPTTVPEFPFIYQGPYPALAGLPELQDAIRDENVVKFLVEGTDYQVINRQQIAFKAEPPEKMWARRSLFDEENPWNNFGFLMDIYQPNSPRYVNVLQGLWFAFWTGPKPSNVKKSLYLLFGLPTAQEDGVVESVTSTTITNLSDSGVRRTHTIPSGLVSLVVPGQRVTKFDPLVSGIEVFDKVNRPGFIRDEIGRPGIERFLTENASKGPGEDTDETKALTLLEEYTFLPQISVESFVNPDINLANVKTFLDAIKPLNKTYLFQVIVGTFDDLLGLKEIAGANPDIDLSENVDSNTTTFLEEATLDAYETTVDPGLALDPSGVLFQENVVIEVYSFSMLIDTFTA